jgi:hypothetical protein
MPLVSKSDNTNQVINEITILSVSIGLYNLLDVSLEIKGKTYMGYAVIIFTSLNILYNVIRAAYKTYI